MRALLIALVLLMGSTAVMAQITKAQNNDREIDPAKKADIIKLFEVTNTTEQAEMVLSKYREILGQTYANIPDEWWDEVLAELISTSFQNMLIPIYDRHLTHEEVKSVIALFETPAGQRYIEVMPAIAIESMEVGAKWGQQLMMDIMERIEKEGFKKKS